MMYDRPMKRAGRLLRFGEHAWTLARRSRVNASALLLLGASACAEPSYGFPVDSAIPPAGATHEAGGNDAAAQGAGTAATRDAAPTQPEADAEASSDSGVPDAADMPVADPITLPGWAETLLGSYVVQSYRFARDRDGSVVRVSVLSLVHITRNGAGAQMEQQLCSLIEDTASDMQTVNDPSGLTEVRQLQFSEGGWSSDASPIGFGYDRDVPARCVGKENQAVSKLPEQVWLSGSTCRCPSSAELAPRIDDCRVRDPDDDSKPGIAFVERSTSGLLLATFHTTYVSRSHVVRGRVATDRRHYGDLLVDDVAYQMSCEPSGCPTISDLSRPCTSEYNGMQFVPLPENADSSCAALVRRKAEFFPDPPPVLPTNCTRQVLTDDPTRE